MSNRHCHRDALPRIMLKNSRAWLTNFYRIHHKLETSPISDKRKFCYENFEDGEKNRRRRYHQTFLESVCQESIKGASLENFSIWFVKAVT